MAHHKTTHGKDDEQDVSGGSFADSDDAGFPIFRRFKVQRMLVAKSRFCFFKGNFVFGLVRLVLSLVPLEFHDLNLES